MILAIGSLGLPVGTSGWREGVAFAHQHPILFTIEYIVFWGLFVSIPFIVNYFEKRKFSRRGAI